jgi:hypothetical protein
MTTPGITFRKRALDEEQFRLVLDDAQHGRHGCKARLGSRHGIHHRQLPNPLREPSYVGLREGTCEIGQSSTSPPAATQSRMPPLIEATSV